MKKLVAIGIAVLVLALVAAPAMAVFPGCFPGMPGCGGSGGGSDGIDIDNHAKVFTKVYTKADSGDNYINGSMVFGGKIVTGAASATSDLYTDVNSSMLGCYKCDGDVDIDNHARVYTKVYTKADSGDNYINGMCVGGGKITTGATNARSIVDSVVNFTLIGMELD